MDTDRKIDTTSSLVRRNLWESPTYRPYVGCSHMARANFDGEQFGCPCGWKTKYEPEFIAAWLAHHDFPEGYRDPSISVRHWERSFDDAVKAVISKREKTLAPTVLRSIEDQSVNFLTPKGAGTLEARYVRRNDDYFIVYLSSQSGCAQSCRFCHLTATRQTSTDQATARDYRYQARQVFDYYRTQPPVKAGGHVHFNFMARGEPLTNPVLTDLTGAVMLLTDLETMARDCQLESKVKISTIMPCYPKVVTPTLIALKGCGAELYYSLYSMNRSFRKRWLPKAEDPHAALAKIKESGISLCLHHAFIAGENDSEDDVDQILAALVTHGLTAKVNIVRFNPADEKYVEPPLGKIEALTKRFSDHPNVTRAKIVSRVGFDVKASCGMFIS